MRWVVPPSASRGGHTRLTRDAQLVFSPEKINLIEILRSVERLVQLSLCSGKWRLEMITYEVNLEIDREVAEAYGAWLRSHVDELLAIDGFQEAHCHEVESEPDGPLCLTVHYRVETREQLEAYFREHAARLRGDGVAAFEGRFSAERRIYRKLW